LIDRTLVLIPKKYRPEELLGYEIPGLGLVLTLLVMLITGAMSFYRKFLLFALFIQQSNK